MRMLQSLVRESVFGAIVRYITNNKSLSQNWDSEDSQLESKLEDSDENIRSGTTSSSELLAEGPKEVDWEGPNDNRNPRNWAPSLKFIAALIPCYLTFSIYLGVAIYSPSVEDIMKDFNIGRVVAMLPLSLTFIGFGVGPLLLGPLSENPSTGRSIVFASSFLCYLMFQVGSAEVSNIGGLSVLRFFSGISGSSALSTSGGSLGDLYSGPSLSLAICAWGSFLLVGLGLAPFLGSIFEVRASWRWDFWFLSINSGVCFLLSLFFLPETYGKTILYRKAKMLTKTTGTQYVFENDTAPKSWGRLLMELLWRPVEIAVLEPIALFIHLYLTLVSAVLYIWFEAIPIVFVGVFHFSTIAMGCAFLAMLVGILFGGIIYISFLLKVFIKKDKSKPFRFETLMLITVVGGVMMTVGLFLFGWSSSPKSHWIGPIIAVVICSASTFISYQSLFFYLGLAFPQYIASVFAGNSFFRSAIAGTFPLFATIMFNNTAIKDFPVAWGSSILGFISLAMSFIPIYFYLKGDTLRSKSKYSG